MTGPIKPTGVGKEIHAWFHPATSMMQADTIDNDRWSGYLLEHGWLRVIYRIPSLGVMRRSGEIVLLLAGEDWKAK